MEVMEAKKEQAKAYLFLLGFGGGSKALIWPAASPIERENLK